MSKGRIERLIAVAGIAAACVAGFAGFIAVLPMMIPHASHAATQDEALVSAGKAVFGQSGCAGCHNSGMAPKLDGVGRRLNAAQLRQKLTTSGSMMPSYAALAAEPVAGDKKASQLDALIAYLQSQQ